MQERSQHPLLSAEYPTDGSARDEWILNRRPARHAANPFRPHGFFLESERCESGEVGRGVTIFLTNRECPWRCLMCDLWQSTLDSTVPVGAIPAQIDYAFEQLGMGRPGPGVRPLAQVAAPSQIKLYNAGSFFDPRAIPPSDLELIAERVCGFERVIVECHPSLIRQSCARFSEQLERAAKLLTPANSQPPQLEVAMGLETVHPEILEKLNKRMTLAQFTKAADFLREANLALRVFVLVQPPFLDEEAGLEWTRRSTAFAFDAGATVVSLIPTRPGNGALDDLKSRGQFSPPKLAAVEAAHADGIRLGRGRVFLDLWDLEKFSDCPSCFPARLERLQRMNLEQTPFPPIRCDSCGAEGALSA